MYVRYKEIYMNNEFIKWDKLDVETRYIIDAAAQILIVMDLLTKSGNTTAEYNFSKRLNGSDFTIDSSIRNDSELKEFQLRMSINNVSMDNAYRHGEQLQRIFGNNSKNSLFKKYVITDQRISVGNIIRKNEMSYVSLHIEAKFVAIED